MMRVKRVCKAIILGAGLFVDVAIIMVAGGVSDLSSSNVWALRLLALVLMHLAYKLNNSIISILGYLGIIMLLIFVAFCA